MNRPFSIYNPDILICNNESVESIRKLTKLLTLFLKEFSKLTEAYVLDYFVEELWTCLPNSWIEIVMEFESHDLEKFINFKKQMRYKKPWPLSLLTFRAAAFSLALPRQPVQSLKSVKEFIIKNFNNVNILYNTVNWGSLDSAYEDKSGQHKIIPEYCRRHVKPKKQHEIFRMAQLTAAVSEALGIKYIIDVGAGQGHLSRLLSFCYNLNVSTVEAEQTYVSTASSFDKQAFKTVQNLKSSPSVLEDKAFSYNQYPKLPQHLKSLITLDSSKEVLTKIFSETNVESANCTPEEAFTLLGLHTCGDLAATIIKLFTEVEECKALLSVGCCYMKLTSNVEDQGYPLSIFVKNLPFHYLSYEAREMACHALEMYSQRLKENIPALKIHCYRATLEKCIVHHYPNNRHMGLRGVKHAELLEFSEYAEKALSKVFLAIPKEFFHSQEIKSCLNRWREVLVFYTLRLITAPVIESLILLDRMLFLFEQGYASCIVPLFDPLLSPRNHVLLSASLNNNNK